LRTTLRTFLLLAVAALTLPGCPLVRFLVCRHEPDPAPLALTRDTPEKAVEYFVDALLRERTREMYESLHPDLVEELDGVSLSDFTGAYHATKEDFAADAALLDEAERSQVTYEGRRAVVTLASGDAHITLILEDRPRSRIELEDDFFPPGSHVDGTFDPDGALRVEGDALVVTTAIALPEGVAPGPDAVKRVSLHHDWLLRSWRDAEGIQFLDRLREEAEGPHE
jgi:hypothetical protein